MCILKKGRWLCADKEALEGLVKNKISLTGPVSKIFSKGEGFTLIELMVAMMILSIGIVFILRTFMSSISALDSGVNRLKAVQFLEQKLAEIEQRVKEEEGIELENTQGDVLLGVRPATWTLEVLPIEWRAEEMEVVGIYEVKVTLSWLETGKSKKMILATYCPAQETGEKL